VTATTALQLGPQGRIVIPSGLRQALGLEVGAQLLASVVDGALVIQTPAQMQANLSQRFFSRFNDVAFKQRMDRYDELPSDSLIAERRAEFAREEIREKAREQQRGQTRPQP
jgi:bifunctional DNA-binding transcriptional regulator/antitoxin component of YhaV-PrlF toxin-antitoxin module